MYEAFYGLRERPFNLTPDPRYLYLSEKHKEAFAHLLYGIKDRSGFVMVSGEVGTGKTTICRTLLNQLEDDTEVAYIINPYLAPDDLLRTINEDFGISSKGETTKALIDELNEYLLEQNSMGKNCVLVIDEAQDLTPDVLEQVRLLSNLETETQKLLQIVLIGQPELVQLLHLPRLRQLNQRITARYHLKPLNFEETLQYIAYRIRVAGGRNKVHFGRKAVKALYRASGGTPRVINALCDRALLIGYTLGQREITPATIKRARAEIRGERVSAPKPRSRAWKLVPAAVTIALAIGAAAHFLSPWYQRVLADWRAAYETAAVQSAEAPAGMIVDAAGPNAPGAPEEVGEPGNIDSTAPPPGDVIGPAAEAETDAAQTGEPVPETEPPAVDAAQAATADDSPREAEPEAAAAPASEQAESAPETSAASAEEATPNGEPTADAAPSREAPPAIARAIEGLTPSAAREATANHLLRVWGRALNGPLPPDNSAQGFADLAAAYSLDTIIFPQADLATLLACDLPAAILIRDDNRRLWAALIEAGAGPVRLALGSGIIEAPLEELEAVYTGQAVVLWNDPMPDSPTLREGSTGDHVRRFQEYLRALNLLTDVSGAYNAATVKAVETLQDRARLTVDGVAGRQTRMLATSWLPEFETPSLKRGTSLPAMQQVAHAAQAPPFPRESDAAQGSGLETASETPATVDPEPEVIEGDGLTADTLAAGPAHEEAPATADDEAEETEDDADVRSVPSNGTAEPPVIEGVDGVRVIVEDLDTPVPLGRPDAREPTRTPRAVTAPAQTGIPLVPSDPSGMLSAPEEDSP